MIDKSKEGPLKDEEREIKFLIKTQTVKVNNNVKRGELD